MGELKYKRVLLKVSGEALAGSASRGLDFTVIDKVCDVIARCNQEGVEVGIVVGGGNFWRGLKDGKGMHERTRADHMGMLATTINCLALADILEQKGVDVRVQTAIEMRAIAEPYIRSRAIRHLEKGRVVIFGCGTGNPFFSTDTAAVLRAAEELLPGIPVVLGGDLNTNTFDGRDKDAIREIAGSPALQRRCLEDVAQYEAALTAAEAMGYRAVPETPILTRRKPLPGGGCLGLRLDWLLLRGMTPTKSRTLSTRTADCGFARPDSALARCAGEELSDHNAVWAACRMGVKDAK